MHYKYILNCPDEMNGVLVRRGWRRFGLYFSRPNCQACSECRNIRIDAQNFDFSRSARRTMRRNQSTQIIIQEPTLSPAHLALYEKYHRHMQGKKGWRYYELSPRSYFELHVAGAGGFGKEALYLRDGKLIGVDLIDFTDDGISSIYFYYDPDYAHLSLGRYSIYQQILLARRMGLRWIYLGYYVRDCKSLCYKADYTPHQFLQGLPGMEDKEEWR
jgi:arginine-tRNA-protein transferase